LSKDKVFHEDVENLLEVLPWFRGAFGRADVAAMQQKCRKSLIQPR
jgi:hypothetical protein